MGGIEILAATVIFILGAIGIIRGPSKELGVTMALVVVLAIFAQFETLVGIDQLPVRVNNLMGGLGFDTTDPLQQRTVVVFLYSAVLTLTAFLAYHGEDTLAFKLDDPKGALGALAGWLAGALNGYLIFGTVWFYLDYYNYPIQRYEWFTPNLTRTAQSLITFLPQNIAGGMIMAALALALLWWRILR
jgi:hypothetical protein